MNKKIATVFTICEVVDLDSDLIKIIFKTNRKDYYTGEKIPLYIDMTTYNEICKIAEFPMFPYASYKTYHNDIYSLKDEKFIGIFEIRYTSIFEVGIGDLINVIKLKDILGGTKNG